jgi:uncharacterized protein YbjT (DUF2867 family)
MMMIHHATTALWGALIGIIAIGPQLSLAFSPVTKISPSARNVLPSRIQLFSSNNNDIERQEDDGVKQPPPGMAMDRRGLLLSIGSGIVMSNILLTPLVSAALAEEGAAAKSTVVVAGATGQTGRRVLERLVADAGKNGWQVVAGVRSVESATKSLSESSTVIRGAMVQKVASVANIASGLDLRRLDVVKDSVDDLTATLQGADKLVIAVGFVPGNPLKMSQAAHEVDNVGTCKLIDAAKRAKVKKVVMVSSILTNGRAWGQEKAPGFVVTNAFGGVLDEKIVAENYLRASGLDYTIVRPGGLKAKPPTGALFVSGEDTLLAGEISRDLVADVCVASLTDSKVSNKVIEIIEDEGKPAQVFNGISM